MKGGSEQLTKLTNREDDEFKQTSRVYLRVLLCFQKMEEEKVDFHKVVLFPILSNANSPNKHS